jgi:hypothetical protein
MARVRLLSIPAGAKVDAEGKGYGDDWGPLADFGVDDAGTRHYLTTDHAHASDLCDDDVISDPATLGAFVVEALNGRGWRWTKHNPPPTDRDVLAADESGCAVRRWIGHTFENTDTGEEWMAPRWRELPALPPPPRPAYVPPPPEVYVHPDPDAHECGNCKHWRNLVGDTGVCECPSCPWDTPERQASLDAWAASVQGEDECPGDAWEAKP